VSDSDSETHESPVNIGSQENPYILRSASTSAARRRKSSVAKVCGFKGMWCGASRSAVARSQTRRPSSVDAAQMPTFDTVSRVMRWLFPWLHRNLGVIVVVVWGFVHVFGPVVLDS
jgi:hypothetical protein